MDILSTLIHVAALTGVCVLLPGALLARRFVGPRDGLEAFAYALGLGATSVSFVGYGAAMLSGRFVGPGWYATVAALHVLVLHREARAALAELRARDRAAWLPRSPRRAIRTAAGVLAVFVFALLVYDVELTHLTCINYRVALAQGIGMGTERLWDRNELLSFPWTGRGGTPMLVSVFPALFGFLGLRLSFAITLLSIVLFTTLAARPLVRRPWCAGVAAFALIAVRPIVDVSEIDQNLIGLSLAAMLFALVLRERWSPFLVGALAGIGFTVEHLMLPSLAAFAWLAWRRPDRRVALATLCAGFAIPAALESVHHAAAYGRVLYYEGGLEVWADFVAKVPVVRFPHEILGLAFETDTQLNFPFHDRVVRSAYNAQPVFLLFPLHLLAGYGVLAASASAVGFVRLARERRALAIALLLFTSPYWLFLQFQENWSDLLKMRLVLPFLVVPALGFARGLDALAEPAGRRREGLAVAALAVLLAVGVRSTRQLDVPQDERLYASHPQLKPEIPAEHALERERMSVVHWLPGIDPLELATFRFPASARSLAGELARPEFEDQRVPLVEWVESIAAEHYYERTFAPRFAEDADGRALGWRPRHGDGAGVRAARDPVLLELDLSEPLVPNPRWLDVVEAPPAGTEAVRVGESAVARVENLAVPWAPNPVDLLLLETDYGGHPITLLLTFLRDPGHYAEPPRPLPGHRLHVQVDRGRSLSVLHMIHYFPAVAYRWNARWTADGLRLPPPVKE